MKHVGTSLNSLSIPNLKTKHPKYRSIDVDKDKKRLKNEDETGKVEPLNYLYEKDKTPLI